MPTEQNYVGGDSHAKHPELTVENTVQVGSPTPQGPPQTSDLPHSAPSAEADAPNPSSPPVTPQLVRGDEEPLLVPLTPYFTRVTSTRANVSAFRELLGDVIYDYATSTKFISRKRVEGIDDTAILHSLYSGIAVFIERTADFRLGARQIDPGLLPGDPARPDPVVDPAAHVLYGGDLLTVTDVATLQGWVSMLQTQNEVTAIRLENEAQAFRGEIEELRSKLEIERDRLLIANRKITELENRPAPIAAPLAPRPQVEYSINLSLGLGYGSNRTAEVNLVQQSLEDNYTATLRRAFNAIAEGEYDNAYVEFADAELIKELLAEISSSLHDAALNGLVVAKGRFDTSKVHDANFEEFMNKYLPGISA